MIKNKNIMILVDRFIPYSSANGICCENIIQKFIENNCRIWIGSYKLPTDTLKENNNCTLFSIGSIKKTDNSVSFFTKIIHYVKWIIPLSKFPATLNHKKANVIIKGCKKILDKYSIDYVICFHFPVEILYAGYKLKMSYPKVKFISYIIDPLFGGFLPNYLRADFCNKKYLKWEAVFFERYDLNILMESNYKLHNKNAFNENIFNKIIPLDVPYLKNPNKSLTVHNSNHKPVVFFCGLLEYPRRNVKFILDLANKMDDVDFVFAGKTNYKDLVDNSLPANIHYLGEISHENVLKHLETSDFFLNLGVKSKSAVSGKIFEYMSYGKPIISTYSFKEETCIKYLEQYSLSYLIDENNPDIVTQTTDLSLFIKQYLGKRMSFEMIEKLFINNLPETFYYRINSFFEGE